MNITFMNCDNDDYVADSEFDRHKEYNLDDCVLVRTTDIFPFDKIVQTPINGHAYGLDKSSIIGDSINEKIKQDYFLKGCFDIEKIIEETKKYYVCFSVQRTTIHFTINGLVSSHLYGNFENKSYIIIEPLKYHIQDKSLLSLRVEDTYFNGDMVLSDDAAIIISEEKFNEIKNNPEYISTLEKFKVFVYKGKNEKEAVKVTLEKLGYDSFITNNNGYLNGLSDNSAAYKMYQFINLLHQKYSINNERHYYSEVQQQDSLNTNKLGEKTDMEHFIYLIKNATSLTDELRENLLKIVTDNNINKKELANIIPEVISILTLEEIEKLTKQFNQQFIENIKLEKDYKIK